MEPIGSYSKLSGFGGEAIRFVDRGPKLFARALEIMFDCLSSAFD